MATTRRGPHGLSGPLGGGGRSLSYPRPANPWRGPAATETRRSGALVSPLWAATVFLGSGLLFVIQPMIARMLLPRVGGAPSTWTTCVLFFQAVLLAGYVYAHWVGRRPARTQLAIQTALLLLPLGMLPFSIA